MSEDGNGDDEDKIHEDVAAISQSDASKGRFIPVFYGDCVLARGSIFGPSGGRLNMTLKPNLAEIMHIPKAHRLVASNGM